MARTPWISILLCGTAFGTFGCEEAGEPAAAAPVAVTQVGATAAPNDAPIPELSVAEVAALLDSDAAVAVDANSERTRREHGTLPGARLLTSAGRFDPQAELPSDQATKLVFYCANEDCGASEGAAARAREHGFNDVNVMRAGIMGWTGSGQTAAELPAS